jgi:hypothetical protein
MLAVTGELDASTSSNFCAFGSFRSFRFLGCHRITTVVAR